MAQFVKVTKDIVIDLDKVSHVSHDASGFYSLSGHIKSISIHLDNGESVQVMEDDEQYQCWLNFLNSKETFERYSARVAQPRSFQDHFEHVQDQAGIVKVEQSS